MSNHVIAIQQDQSGRFWFGTWVDGVSVFDGHSFTTLTTDDGLAGNGIIVIFRDKTGNLWIGGGNKALSLYDGRTLTPFNAEDPFACAVVHTICQDRNGVLWFGTFSFGATRYDGQTFERFTIADGLAHTNAYSICEDRHGRIWFGTLGGGVSVFDGRVFQTITDADGLASNSVQSISVDETGNIWLRTSNGLTRYRQPPPCPPRVSIDAVVADQRYDSVDKVEIEIGVRLVAFEYHARSFKTRPEAMVYRYRLIGYDADWKNTKSRRIEYPDLPEGDYTFELQAAGGGMPPLIILRSNGRVEELMVEGLPLGALDGEKYGLTEFRLEKEDVLILMSDGLPERLNNRGEMYGDSRLAMAIQNASRIGQNASEIVERVVKSGDSWSNGTPQADDVTVVVLKVK